MHFLAEMALSADEIATLQNGASTDAHLLAENAIRSDVRAPVNLGRGRYDCGRVNAGGEDGLGKKQRQDFGKCNAGIGHANQDLLTGSEGLVNNDRRRRALLSPREIVLVLSESQVAGLGAVGRGKAFQHQIGVTHDFTSQTVGNFSDGKWH